MIMYVSDEAIDSQVREAVSPNLLRRIARRSVIDFYDVVCGVKPIEAFDEEATEEDEEIDFEAMSDEYFDEYFEELCDITTFFMEGGTYENEEDNAIVLGDLYYYIEYLNTKLIQLGDVIAEDKRQAVFDAIYDGLELVQKLNEEDEGECFEQN